MIELTAHCEHMDQVKADTIVEFQMSQPYFDELGVQYGNDFEDFHKQATLLFPGVDMSQVQINFSIPMTLTSGVVLDEEETDIGRTEATTMVANGTVGQEEKETDGPREKKAYKQSIKPTDEP